jgi:hypothetical protein
MKHWTPTLQTKFNKDGDCLAACIATLFPISIEAVPFFEEGDHDWQAKLSIWFEKTFNKFIVGVRYEDMPTAIEQMRGLVITTIKSTNEKVERHAVVSEGGVIVFDPMRGEIEEKLTVEHDPAFFCIGDIFKK